MVSISTPSNLKRSKSSIQKKLKSNIIYPFTQLQEKKTTSIKAFIYHHHPHQHIVIVNANIIYFVFTLMCHVIKV